jgi:4-amino-4-deoxy-L-arabinose transferase-like glycosyltransferase
VARKIPRLLWLVAPLAFFLYFFRLGGAGLMGPDEPRYAWIGRAMAQSGDWVTPRLYGQPWFEKPALLYWMTGAAFRAGLGPDLAPRLPVALLGTAFLLFYWWMLRREFGCRAAGLATLVLGSSVAWIGFSRTGVTDLPLTAAFSMAMLLALPWVARRDGRFLPAAFAALGVAVLAKGPVAVALGAPLAIRVRWIRDLLRPRVLLPFFAIALPWYVLCYARNGWPFIDEFIVRHNLGRFTSGELQHVRPWWFYLPIAPALLLPWTPLLLLLVKRTSWYREPRRGFLLAWSLFGLALFSASANKLPGYVLPLLPAVAALIGVALDEAADARWWLGACAVLLVGFPAAAAVFPWAVANEWGSAPRVAFDWTWLLPVVVAAAAWALESRGRRVAATVAVTIGAAVGLTYLEIRSEPGMERVATARSLARQAAPQLADLCLEPIKRDWQYGLQYYLGTAIPSCEAKPSAFHIMQAPGRPPELTPAANRTGTGEAPPPVDPR